MIQAVILDMDGTMLMTETLSSRAFCKVLSDCGKQLVMNPWGCVQQIGTIGNMANLKKQYGLWQPLWWLQLKYGLAYRECVCQDGQALPGLLTLLELVKEHRLPMAVASGSLDKTIKMIIKYLGIRHYFQHLVSSRRLKHNKPFPDVYLEAARRLRILPAACLVVEDSGIGVAAGKAAGMKVIAVPNRFTVNGDFSRADKVLESLEDLTWGVISSL